MEIKREILEQILQKKEKRARKGEKRDKLLQLKDEILALKEQGLSASDIVEYLRKAHKLKVNVTYLRRVIPELADKPGAIVNILGRNEPKEKIIGYLIEAAEKLGISRREFAAELLKNLSDEEIAEVWKELGAERLKSTLAIYKTRHAQSSDWNRNY